MNPLLERAQVLLKAVPTYLVAAAMVVNVIADELADAFPGNAATVITKVGTRIVTGLTAVVAIVRRVTPVDRDERGLLEPPVKTG